MESLEKFYKKITKYPLRVGIKNIDIIKKIIRKLKKYENQLKKGYKFGIDPVINENQSRIVECTKVLDIHNLEEHNKTLYNKLNDKFKDPIFNKNKKMIVNCFYDLVEYIIYNRNNIDLLKNIVNSFEFINSPQFKYLINNHVEELINIDHVNDMIHKHINDEDAELFKQKLIDLLKKTTKFPLSEEFFNEFINRHK